jgi:serine/threonine-protein phosphatase 2A regulatory subunit B'
LEKERNLSIHLLEGILKYWPFANYLKEALFLQELSEILIFCDLDNIQPLVNKLFKRIVKCISENHLQVAEEAMCLFESESFISIIKRYNTISFDILVPSVNYLAENHWYPQLQNQFGAIKEYLKKIDPQAFNNALETVNQKNPDKNVRIPIAPEEGRKLNQKWKNYIKIAKKKNPGYFDTISAFADKNIIWDYNSVYRNIYNKEEEYLG